MADAARADDPADPPLRTLADKVNWLIDRAHPAGRGHYSNAEITALIEKVTGEQFSHTTIWKLRNGQAANPQMRLIEALARTFGVPPAFFFSDYDDLLQRLRRREGRTAPRASRAARPRPRYRRHQCAAARNARAEPRRPPGRRRPHRAHRPNRSEAESPRSVVNEWS